jgi:hypothetical protein
LLRANNPTIVRQIFVLRVIFGLFFIFGFPFLAIDFSVRRPLGFMIQASPIFRVIRDEVRKEFRIFQEQPPNPAKSGSTRMRGSLDRPKIHLHQKRLRIA